MKNPKKKVGRPKMPKSKRRRHRLYLNLTDDELKLVYGKAKENFLNPRFIARGLD